MFLWYHLSILHICTDFIVAGLLIKCHKDFMSNIVGKKSHIQSEQSLVLPERKVGLGL